MKRSCNIYNSMCEYQYGFLSDLMMESLIKRENEVGFVIPVGEFKGEEDVIGRGISEGNVWV